MSTDIDTQGRRRERSESNSLYFKYLGKKNFGAFWESFALLSLLTGIAYYFDSPDRWLSVQPHPFWAVVLLMASHYGTGAGLSSAFLCTVFLYAWNLPSPEFGETLFDYQTRITLLPFLWFSVGFGLGEIRQRLEIERKQIKSDLEDLRSDSDTVLRAYDSLRETKESQDRLIAGQRRTVVSIFRSFMHLSETSTTQMLLHLDEVFATAFKPEKFSVYACGPNGLEIVSSRGWEETDQFQRRISPDMELYQQVVDERRVVSVIDDEQAKLFDGEGIIAAPLVDAGEDKVIGMVKIEKVDYLEFNFDTLEAFHLLCELVGSAYANARRLRILQRYSLFSGHQILSYEAGKFLRLRFAALAEKEQLSYAEICIRPQIQEELPVSESFLESRLVEHVRALLGKEVWLFRDHRKKLDLRAFIFATERDAALFHASSLMAKIQQDPDIEGVKVSVTLADAPASSSASSLASKGKPHG